MPEIKSPSTRNETITVMRKYSLLLITLLAIGSGQIYAQGVSFRAKAPSSVPMGNPFQLSFTINTLADPNELRLPDINGFEIIAGPYTAQSEQNVNGHYSSSMTFTYMLMPKKEGNYSIGPASITINKQRYTSNGLSIKVLPADKTQKNNDNNVQSQSGTTVQAPSGQDVFMRANVSKTRVFEQEAFLVTYKLYSLTDVVGWEDFKAPDFKGFVIQQIDLPNDRPKQLEHFNGRNYTTYPLYQVLLFPQRSGSMDIEKASGTFILRLRTQRKVRSIFDDFFDTYQDVKKTLVAPPVRISVDPLPVKPTGFSGAVGNFKLNAEISSTSMKSNESVTIRITISGTGNLKLINTLPLKFPQDFEAYEPKVDNNYRTTASGITGTKTMEYLAIPRQPGDFVIAPVGFTYFDIASRSYKTLTTPEYRIHVDKGNGTTTVVSNYTQKEDIKVLNKDIRYIDTDNFTVSKRHEFYIRDISFWMWYLIPLLLAIAFFIIFRKQARNNANLALVRTKKANKMALKRLKLASAYLKEKKKELFYDEVLKAFWGYLSDKLNIPMSALTKEKMKSELEKRAVASETTDHLLKLIDTCEFARYAPADGSDAMDHLFDDAVTVIEELENAIRK
jgi:hypothetical protein